MNILEKVKEVNDYFVEKLVNGDYTVIKYESYTTSVSIDGFVFELWTNAGEEGFRVYADPFSVHIYKEGNHIGLNFSESQKRKAWKNYIAFITDDKKEKLKKEKLAQIKQLEMEISKIK